VHVENFGDGNVSVYTINATTGVLTPVAGSPFAADRCPDDIAIDPRGKFVYATNAVSNNISAYTIDDRQRRAQPHSGIALWHGIGSGGAAVDATGNFAYVANGEDDTVSAYSINATTGALLPVGGSPFAAAKNPEGLAVTRPL
jgi:6-phosphogluconolactonase